MQRLHGAVQCHDLNAITHGVALRAGVNQPLGVDPTAPQRATAAAHFGVLCV
jgi:hypothetical protein